MLGSAVVLGASKARGFSPVVSKSRENSICSAWGAKIGGALFRSLRLRAIPILLLLALGKFLMNCGAAGDARNATNGHLGAMADLPD